MLWEMTKKTCPPELAPRHIAQPLNLLTVGGSVITLPLAWLRVIKNLLQIVSGHVPAEE